MQNPTRITGLSRVELPSPGAEDVLVGEDGVVFTGVRDGWIYRIGPGTDDISRIANTGGVPLGLEFLPDGRILVCDAQRGLLALDRSSGAIERLVNQIDGTPLAFCNNAAVGADGTIFFSQSSTRNGFDPAQRDIIEHIPTGRLFRRAPDGKVDLLLDRLHFANGVCISQDGKILLVAETGAARILRVERGEDTAAGAATFLENLPGLPDNLSIGSDALVWAAIVSPMSERLAALQQSPLLLRKLVARIHPALRPDAARMLRVMAFSLDGQCVHDFEGDSEAFHMVTGVREKHGRVYLGSVAESAIACFSLKRLPIR